MRVKTGLWFGAVIAVSIGLAAGCSSGTSKGLSVSATATSATATSASSGSSAASLDAGNGLSIDRLRLVVRKFEIEGGDDAACPIGPTGPTGPTGPSGPSGPTGPSGMSAAIALHDGGSGSGGHGSDDGMDDHEGECEIEAGPFLVDLSGADLASGVHWVASVDVPAGTWREVKFQIDTISVQEAGSDAGLLAMADAHASIQVDGTKDGAPFTFSLPFEAIQKREGSIVVDPSAGANLTLDIDPTGWFKAADGSRLDPADPSALGAILQNVKASIRVMHDDDGDGHDDEHHGGADDPQPHG